MCCCAGIHLYIYRRKVSILCVCVGEKGIHLSKLYVYYCMALLAEIIRQHRNILKHFINTK